MARPKRIIVWPQVNIRMEPGLHKLMTEVLYDPLYLRLPPRAVQDFINAAVKRELESRGVQCDSPSSNSSTQTGPQYLESF